MSKLTTDQNNPNNRRNGNVAQIGTIQVDAGVYTYAGYETAAWYTEYETDGGRVPLMGTFETDSRTGLPTLKSASYAVQGTIVADNFQSLFGGNRVGKAYDTIKNAGLPYTDTKSLRGYEVATMVAHGSNRIELFEDYALIQHDNYHAAYTRDLHHPNHPRRYGFSHPRRREYMGLQGLHRQPSALPIDQDPQPLDNVTIEALMGVRKFNHATMQIFSTSRFIRHNAIVANDGSQAFELFAMGLSWDTVKALVMPRRRSSATASAKSAQRALEQEIKYAYVTQSHRAEFSVGNQNGVEFSAYNPTDFAALD